MSSNNLEGPKTLIVYILYLCPKPWHKLVLGTVSALKNGSCKINYTNIKCSLLFYIMCTKTYVSQENVSYTRFCEHLENYIVL